VERRVGGADLGRGGDACRSASAAAGRNNNVGVPQNSGSARPSMLASGGGDL